MKVESANKLVKISTVINEVYGACSYGSVQSPIILFCLLFQFLMNPAVIRGYLSELFRSKKH